MPVRFANHGQIRMSALFEDPDGYHFELVVVMDTKEQASRELEKRGIPLGAGNMLPGAGRPMA